MTAAWNHGTPGVAAKSRYLCKLRSRSTSRSENGFALTGRNSSAVVVDNRLRPSCYLVRPPL